MNILINYANEAYRATQKWNSWTGRYIAGFDKVIEYTDENIDDDFRRKNSAILSIPRGNGLWLWKPYFILKALTEASDGDIVVYCDSGSIWIRGIKYILNCLKQQDIWVTVLPFLEEQWTRRECFEVMGCNGKRFEKTNQLQGSFLAFRKNQFTLLFVTEWLNYACDSRCLGERDSRGRSESDGFQAHREDQSILSLLAKKNHLTAFQDPTQFGKYPEQYSESSQWKMRIVHRKDYPVLIILHRQRHFVFRVFRQILCLILCPEWLGHRLMHRDFGNFVK